MLTDKKKAKMVNCEFKRIRDAPSNAQLHIVWPSRVTMAWANGSNKTQTSWSLCVCVCMAWIGSASVCIPCRKTTFYNLKNSFRFWLNDKYASSPRCMHVIFRVSSSQIVFRREETKSNRKFLRWIVIYQYQSVCGVRAHGSLQVNRHQRILAHRRTVLIHCFSEQTLIGTTENKINDINQTVAR